MNDVERKKKEFIAYEYKEIVAEASKASFFLDGYENFGWKVDENKKTSNLSMYEPYQKKVVLHLKRNRKIINKMELTRLQRNFEACVKEMEELEKSKTSKAVMYSLMIGILGTAFMAGSVFAITAKTPMIVLSILLAIPALIGWILPCFVYRKLVKEQTEKVNQIIEQKYDEIYEICEKGNKLLH